MGKKRGGGWAAGRGRERPEALLRSLGCPEGSGCHCGALGREGTCHLGGGLWGPLGERFVGGWRDTGAGKPLLGLGEAVGSELGQGRRVGEG